MSRFDAVFYDFDGTLADSIPVILKCFHLAYESVFGHCERTDDDFMRFIGRPLEDTFAMHGEEMMKILTDAYLEHNEKMLREDAIDLFDGVREDLLYLKELGIKQGILTSKRRSSCMTTVDLKGIAYPTLTGVSSPSIVLSESRQKAVIEVDEDGTTAATVTHHKGDWNLLPAPGEIIVFNADHPFVFLIREKSSDTILFMGTLTE